MNEQLPYDELIADKLGEIELPNEDMAWEDMKRRLDEDKKRRFLPFWLNGCLGWALIGLLATGLAWWIFNPLQWFEKGKNKSVITIPEKDTSRTNDRQKNHHNTIVISKDKENDKTTSEQQPDTASLTSPKQENEVKPGNTSNENNKPQPVAGIGKKKEGEKDQVNSKGTNPRKTNTGSNRKKNNGVTKKPVINPQNRVEPSPEPQKDTVMTADNSKEPGMDTTRIGVQKYNGPDTAVLKKTDTAIAAVEKKDTAAIKKSNDTTRKKSFTVSAGLGISQQLPVAGQSFVPYNSLGRKGTVRDYIPSLILRLNREQKWFFQSEFRYGAPQYNKEILYRQQTDTNQITQKVTINSTTLLKTYYHQLPLTFNYYVMPGLAIGGGVTWNRYSSAISEQSEVLRDLGTGLDTALNSQVFRVPKGDSSFEKSFWQAVIEGSYQRKKFSAGFRYSFGLQPFIRFTLPGGVEQTEKNSSLQFFLRYELWRSKSK